MPVVQVALPVPLARNFDYALPAHLPLPVAGARQRAFWQAQGDWRGGRHV